MGEKVAIITGAGRGIGRATAVELHHRGYRLVLVSRNENQLRETAAMSDRGAMIAAVDVTDAAAIKKLVEQVVAKFGRVDALVNNAGYAPVRSIEQMTLDEWRAVIDTNLSAAFYLSQACWRVFREQKAGVIVNLSSRAARDPYAGLGMYGSAKAAINLLTWSLAREGEPFGIRVHAIAPGAVETGMFRTIATQEQVPTENTLAPSEVARMIADCIRGPLSHTSGEVIWVHKKL